MLILCLEIELLVELVLDWLLWEIVLEVVDFGIGSGVIVLVLVSEWLYVCIIVIDVSVEVFQMVCCNVVVNGVYNVVFVVGFWYVLLVGQCFVLIVSNLLYIVSGDLYLFQGDLCYELVSVLVFGVDGLDDICVIVVGVGVYLLFGGWLFIEYGWDQGDVICVLFEQVGFDYVFIVCDF